MSILIFMSFMPGWKIRLIRISLLSAVKAVAAQTEVTITSSTVPISSCWPAILPVPLTVVAKVEEEVATGVEEVELQLHPASHQPPDPLSQSPLFLPQLLLPELLVIITNAAPAAGAVALPESASNVRGWINAFSTRFMVFGTVNVLRYAELSGVRHENNQLTVLSFPLLFPASFFTVK